MLLILFVSLPVNGSITSTVLRESPALVKPPTAYNRPTCIPDIE